METTGYNPEADNVLGWVEDEGKRELLSTKVHRVAVVEGAVTTEPTVTNLGERVRGLIKAWEVATKGLIQKTGQVMGEKWFSLPTYGRGLWQPTRVVDEYGAVFKALNLKGAGQTDGVQVVGSPTREDMWIKGLATMGDVTADAKRSEEWLERSKGKLRVRRYLSVVKLDAVSEDEKLVQVEDLCIRYDRKVREAGIGLAMVRNPFTLGDSLDVLSDGRKEIADVFVQVQSEYLADDPLCSKDELKQIRANVDSKALATVYGRMAGEQAGVITNIGFLQDNANLQNLTMAFEAKDFADMKINRPIPIVASNREFGVQVVDYFVGAARVVAAINLAEGRQLDEGFDQLKKEFFGKLSKELGVYKRFILQKTLNRIFDNKILSKEEGLPDVVDVGYWDKKGEVNRMTGVPQGAFVDKAREKEFQERVRSVFDKNRRKIT